MLTLLTILSTVWKFLRSYWQYILIAVVVVGSGTYIGCQRSQFNRRLQDIDVAHRTELAEVMKAYEKELQARELNEQKLIARMTEIQKQYDSARLELDDAKKRQVVDIIKKYGDNPDELARQLATITGFTVILPEEESTCTP